MTGGPGNVFAGAPERRPTPPQVLICETCSIEFSAPTRDEVEHLAEQHQLEQDDPAAHEAVAF